MTPTDHVQIRIGPARRKVDPSRELAVAIVVLGVWVVTLWLTADSGISAAALLGFSLIALLALFVARRLLRRPRARTALLEDLILAFAAIIVGAALMLGFGFYLENLADRPEASLADLERLQGRIDAATAWLPSLAGVLLAGSILAGLGLLWLRKAKVWERVEGKRRGLAGLLRFATIAGLTISGFAAAGAMAGERERRDAMLGLTWRIDGAREARGAAHRLVLVALAERTADDALRRFDPPADACPEALEVEDCDPVTALDETTRRITSLRALYTVPRARDWIGPDPTAAPRVREVEAADRRLADLVSSLEANARPAAALSYDFSPAGITTLSHVRLEEKEVDETRSLKRLAGLILSAASDALPIGLPIDSEPVVGPLVDALLNRIPASIKSGLESLAADIVVETARGCAADGADCQSTLESRLEGAQRDPRFVATSATLFGALERGAMPMLASAAAAAATIEPAHRRYRRLAAGCAGSAGGGACVEIRSNESRLFAARNPGYVDPVAGWEQRARAARPPDRGRSYRPTRVATPRPRG